MLCVFRVDASTEIGTGHVMRCLTLAESLRSHCVASHFVCRLHKGHLCDLIEQKGFTVSRLSAPCSDEVEGNVPKYAPWVGAHWKKDAEETFDDIQGLNEKPEWLIVDHYGLDASWEQHLRPSVGKIFVIDDLANRPHDCDLLLDQNMIEGMRDRYSGLLVDACVPLLGPGYALLQPVYARLHKQLCLREGAVKRILIFMGGADIHNVSGMALQAFLMLNRDDIHVDIVLGCNFPHVQSITALAKENVVVHQDIPCLAPLMAKADLAVGGAGTASWERICMGLPSLVVTLADNQRPIAKFLHREGLVYWLGDREDVDAGQLSDVLHRIIQNGLERRWSRQCYETIDGDGAKRVTAALALGSQAKLVVREMDGSDETLLLDWANDPETRTNSFSNKAITPAEHHKWFTERLTDEKIVVFIIENEDGVPIGQVRFEEIDKKQYLISYSLARQYRFRKLGGCMLKVALQAFMKRKKGSILIARVKNNNIASQRILEKLNFKQMRSNQSPEVMIYQLKAV